MTIFADPTDTGSHRLDLALAETEVIRRRDVGEKTVLMRSDLATMPVSPIRFQTAAHAALPPREGVVLPDTTVEFQPPLPGDPPPVPPSPPPHPPVPPPAWNSRVGEHPLVPRRHRSRTLYVMPANRPRQGRWYRGTRHARPPRWGRGVVSVLILASAFFAYFALVGCTPPPDRSRVPDAGVRPTLHVTPYPTPGPCGGVR